MLNLIIPALLPRGLPPEPRKRARLFLSRPGCGRPWPLLGAVLHLAGCCFKAAKSRVAYTLYRPCRSESRPPTGDRCIYEIKFDGWRAQLQNAGNGSLFLGNGDDFTHRFPEFRDSIAGLATIPPSSMSRSSPAITKGCRMIAPHVGVKPGLCAGPRSDGTWGQGFRSRPLLERRIDLRHLLAKTDDERLRYWRSSRTPIAPRLSRAGWKASFEAFGPAVSLGKNPGWIKVKTATWVKRTGTAGRRSSGLSRSLSAFTSKGPSSRVNPALLALSQLHPAGSSSPMASS